MAITASQVNDLRKKTGAGMMDCKKALVEADGDMEAAVDFLRKKGQKVAAKRGDNEAKEGLIFAESKGEVGYIIQLNCETDFVAKNEDFQNFVKSILEIGIKNDVTSVDDLKKLQYNEKLTVDEKLVEQIGVIGEKLDLTNFGKVSATTVVAYNHPGNQLAALVGLNKSGSESEDAGRQVAMQVAAMNPLSLKKEGISQEVIDRELQVGKDQAIEEGKPAELADKIAQGRLNKFFKENTLLSQDFVRDNKMTVEKFLNSVESGLTVTEFKRFSLS
ncbi:translation elongation factor Ts [Brumimicrobium oceani]|uniref:Elongation factor Ts n=1 Tax=Brumimicrobium oceani TaxID=2100725 RepID=A0A2U2X1C9_9FLAO|nr:translation elongation factor Ts [Brumimicrobium oceani]PWH81570.1 elongation factor Ts [Brumimicrobium oceani]